METESTHFPPFSLTRLLSTVFDPKPGLRIALMIDLPDPREMAHDTFLNRPELTIQRLAHDVFYEGLQQGGLKQLGLRGGEMYAYQVTGGSNLDLPDLAVDAKGHELSLERDIYPNYDLILCISTYSATAPLTAFAKRFGFRGATLHGLNDMILRTGLAVDYNQVSRQAETLRRALNHADRFEIDYTVDGKTFTLNLHCGRQEAQKSHGLCLGEKPDVANLPAGEVYYVPENADGSFPMRFPDGTIGSMEVSGGLIRKATLLSGNAELIEAYNQKLESDPVTGELGELGFGTQELPPAGTDIQDEKILGTLHVATGRSDHLGGKLNPTRFSNPKNATHDDILFSPTKTPEINVPQVRMIRDGKTEVILENYRPAAYLQNVLGK